MDAWRCGTCVVRMRTTGRKTLVSGRTVVYTVVLGPQRSGSPAHAQPRVEPAIYPSQLPFISYCTTVRLDRAFTNVLRPVVRMRTTQVPHRQASTPRPPHVMFLTRPSPSLAIFIACYVARVRGKAWERG